MGLKQHEALLIFGVVIGVVSGIAFLLLEDTIPSFLPFPITGGIIGITLFLIGVYEQQQEQKKNIASTPRPPKIAKRCDVCNNILKYVSQRKEWWCDHCKQYSPEKKMKSDIELAKNYEVALRYDDAIKIYEKYGKWENAGRCRRLQKGEPPQKVVEY